MFGDDSVAEAHAFVTLAQVEETYGNYDIAIDLLTNALRIEEGAFGPDARSIARLLRGLGWNHKEAGRIEEATVNMLRAIDILEALESPPDFEVATLHSDIGDLYVYRKEYERATMHFEGALAVWEKHPGNPTVAIPLTNYGILKNRIGQHAEAMDMCSRALEIDTEALGPDHLDLAYSLTCRGIAAIEMNDYQSAIDELQKAVNLRSRYQTYELGWSQFQLGRALYAAGETEAAYSNIERARSTFEESPAPDPYVREQFDAWVDQHGPEF